MSGRTGVNLRLLLLVQEDLRDLALVDFIELARVELAGGGVHCGAVVFILRGI